MSKGSIQISAATGGGECGGSFILTEVHGVICTGISAGVVGLTGYNVQVSKMAWGTTGEYYWVDDSIRSAGTTGCGSAPLPIQLIDSNGNQVKFSTVAGSAKTALDVVIREQGGSAAYLNISNRFAGNGDTTGNYIAVAGTTNGGYIPVAGSTVGGAIPHIGSTTDILGSLTFGAMTAGHASAATGAFSGTVSAKLRNIAGGVHQLIAGGTGADGVYRIGGISADIRSIPTVTVQATGGMTAAISAIAGGLTIGIGSVSVDNPVVIGYRVAGFTFEQLNSNSTTLQSGIRVKNVNGSGTLTVTYDSAAGATTGMTSGFQLDDREEMFIEVDNTTKVYVMCGLTAGCTFSYYAT